VAESAKSRIVRSVKLRESGRDLLEQKAGFSVEVELTDYESASTDRGAMQEGRHNGAADRIPE
jgi:hypothetical protein